MENKRIQPYSPVIVKLLQGLMHNDSRELWKILLEYRRPIEEYFSIINVQVILNETDGYAFLDTMESENDDNNMPTLFTKRQLSYPVTLLAILLVEKLIEFDMTGNDSTMLVVSKSQMIEMMRVFLADRTNEVKMIDSIDLPINRLLEYGFIRKLKNDKDEYEVKRILKAKINGTVLSEIREKLKTYVPE